ncbi:MAG TPA: hypothetical protein DCM14_00780 [Clostridiales bacterium UBA8153]|nr:hypothetical protein [Clostridiales bacterium UBA8153]
MSASTPGEFLPAIPGFLGKFEYAQASIPIATLRWLMLYPMMIRADFASFDNAGKTRKACMLHG